MNGPQETDAGDAERLAVELLRRLPVRPRAAVVLGSGLGGISRQIEARHCWPFHELPGFAPATAVGHPGNLIYGMWQGVAVVALQGRLHLYEGHSLEAVTYPVRVMHAMGARRLILSNAAGGINAGYRVGDLMVIRDQISFLRRRPHGLSAVRDVYDMPLVDASLRLARELHLPLHAGVYAAMTGPNYETRAEYRMLRRCGADAVGMSTVPEALTAVSLGMRVVGLSVVTNECSPDALHVASGEAVVRAAQQAEHHLAQLVRHLIQIA